MLTPVGGGKLTGHTTLKDLVALVASHPATWVNANDAELRKAEV